MPRIPPTPCTANTSSESSINQRCFTISTATKHTTAPLTPKEVDTLFGIARRLRGEGRSIVFITHRLEEVRALCDRVTIFRDGNKIATKAFDLGTGIGGSLGGYAWDKVSNGALEGTVFG